MAFTGTAATEMLGDSICKISAVTLAASATGTITNTGGGGDITIASPTIDSDTEIAIMGDELCRASESSGTVTITNGDGANASESLVIFVKRQWLT